MDASERRRPDRRSPIRRLTAYDQHCLRVERSDRPLQMGVLAVLGGRGLLDAEGRLPIDAIRRAIDRRLVHVPELRRIVHYPGPLAGGPTWVDDPAFGIERHVTAVDLPPPGDEAALLSLVERLVASPLERSRPLWRMWFISGTEEGPVVLLVVIHHALADGRTAMRMVRTLLDGEDLGAESGPSPPTEVAPPSPWRALTADHLRSIAASARRVVAPSTWRQLAPVIRYGRRAVALGREPSVVSLNAPVGPRRRLAVMRLDGATARATARSACASINDLVLCIVTAGLRALLRDRGELSGRMRPRAGVAVALFSADRSGQPGNDIGTMLVPLPVDEDEPAVRLAHIAAASARARGDPSIAIEPTLRAWVRRIGGARTLEHQRLVNLHETFLPGPPRPIRALGAEVVDLVPIAPLAGNLALSVVALSYAGRITIAVRADADAFPDLDVLIVAMERDWRRLAIRDAPPTPVSSVS